MNLAFSLNKGRPNAQAGSGDAIKVMVVDDSAVIRGMMTKWLESDPEIKVVSSCANGQLAVRAIENAKPDVVVLDIEMPVMDGMEALPQLLKLCPGVRVVMASTLTRRNADISIKALGLGAADYLPKPEINRGVNAEEFKRELLEKVKILGGPRSAGTSRPAARRFTSEAKKPARSTFSSSASTLRDIAKSATGGDEEVKLRPISKIAPKILAIGSSTGGPKALFEFLGHIKNDVGNVPIMITQHMPATFTAILAEHIQNATGLTAKEGEEGEVLEAGRVYVARGDYHMRVVGEGTKRKLEIKQTPPENFCRPAVDPMYRSIAKVYGAATLGVILTGMGQDGCEGARAIVDSGGTILAQDKATSVVWGMPGAVAMAGLCSDVAPIDKLARDVRTLLKGGRI